MRKAFAKLPTTSAILDSELCLISPRGGAMQVARGRGCSYSWPSICCTRTGLIWIGAQTRPQPVVPQVAHDFPQNMSRRFLTARSCSTAATSSGLRVALPSAGSGAHTGPAQANSREPCVCVRRRVSRNLGAQRQGTEAGTQPTQMLDASVERLVVRFAHDDIT